MRIRPRSICFAVASLAAAALLVWWLAQSPDDSYLAVDGAMATAPEALAARPIEDATNHRPPMRIAREALLPEESVLVRVVDERGEPVSEVPVVLLDREVPLALWRGRAGRSPVVYGPDIPLERLTPDAGKQRLDAPRTPRFGSGALLGDGILTATPEIEELPPEAASVPFTPMPWRQDAAPLLRELEHEFARALLARALTDASGAAVLAWDRTTHPRVRVAFPWDLSSSPGEHGALDAGAAPAAARVVLNAPPLERVTVVAEQDLDPASGARWHARIATRPPGTEDPDAWIAWESPRALPGGELDPVCFVWERGLDARLEASVDAPLASVLHLPLEDGAVAERRVALRASEHYSLLRGTVESANGSSLAGAQIELRRSCRGMHGQLYVDRAELALDEAGRFAAWMPARPRELRQRVLCIGLPEGAAPRSAIPGGRNYIEHGGPKIDLHASARDPQREERETYVDLRAPDPAGSVRDLGLLRLGAGPHLVAGRVLWDDGEPLRGGGVLLPPDATPGAGQVHEELVIAANGSFRRLGIADGKLLELLVHEAGHGSVTRFRVASGRLDVELRLLRRGSFGGRVVLDAWVPIDVVVRAANGEEVAGTSRVSGEFLVLGVPTGVGAVSFRSGGVELHRVEGVLIEARQNSHPEVLREVDLRPLVRSITLELRDEARKLLRKQPFELASLTAGFALRASTREDGRFVAAVPRSLTSAALRVAKYRETEVRFADQPVTVELVRER
jgi:hypothetical protein